MGDPAQAREGEPGLTSQAAEIEKPGGLHDLGMEHVQRFAETHPLGSRAYLAMALMLYTGQRRGDARQQVKDEAIQFVQQKGERTSQKQSRIVSHH